MSLAACGIAIGAQFATTHEESFAPKGANVKALRAKILRHEPLSRFGSG